MGRNRSSEHNERCSASLITLSSQDWFPTGRLITILPFLFVSAIYLPNLGQSFIGLDIDSYKAVLHSNQFVDTTLLLFRDFYSKLVGGYYAPLSSVTLIFDKLLIGSDVPVPWLTYLINFLFHCLNGILLYMLLGELGAGPFVRVMTTFIFLVSPIQVSCVLWAAERKTVMAGTFYVAAFIAYLRFRRTSVRTYYVLALTAFAAGLLSKPTVLVLPLVLLITEMLGMVPDDRKTVDVPDTDYGQSASWTEGIREHPFGKLVRRFFPNGHPGKILIYLAPFLIGAVFWSLITMKTEGGDPSRLPLAHRPFIMSTAIWFYLYKVVLPLNLVPVHRMWTVNVLELRWWIPFVSLIILTGVLIRRRRQIEKRIWWGLANFLVPLLPVLGIVSFGWQQHSFVGIHLLYLSMIGAGYCISVLLERFLTSTHSWRRYLGLLLTILYCCFLPITAFLEAKVWADPLLLWARNVKENPANSGVRTLLGAALLDAGRLSEAEKAFREAIRTNPADSRGYTNLGGVLLKLGKARDAERLLRKAVKMKPDQPAAYMRLGEALLRQGKESEGAGMLQKAIRLDPFASQPYNNLGYVMLGRGKLKEAERLFRRAIQLRPRSEESHANLGAVMMTAGRNREAHKHFQESVRINPDFAKGHANLGIVCLRMRRVTEAIRYLKRAIELDPSLTVARLHLGRAFEARGANHRAVAEYSKAVKADPAFIEARFHLARALVKRGAILPAIEQYEKILEANPKDYTIHNSLGRLFMARSMWKKAEYHFRRALAIRPDLNTVQRNLETVVKALEDSESGRR